MANLRKLIALALGGADLSTDPYGESAIDRIGAMAWSNRLGGELWRLREGHDAAAFGRAVRLLVKATRRPHHSVDWYRRLCALAVEEWLYAVCRTCGGSGHLQATEIAPVRVCSVCDGSGRGYFSDQWRMSRLGLNPAAYSRWRPRIALIHDRIAAADAEEYRQISLQLERFVPRSAAKKVLDRIGAAGYKADNPPGAQR